MILLRYRQLTGWHVQGPTARNRKSAAEFARIADHRMVATPFCKSTTSKTCSRVLCVPLPASRLTPCAVRTCALTRPTRHSQMALERGLGGWTPPHVAGPACGGPQACDVPPSRFWCWWRRWAGRRVVPRTCVPPSAACTRPSGHACVKFVLLTAGSMWFGFWCVAGWASTGRVAQVCDVGWPKTLLDFLAAWSRRPVWQCVLGCSMVPHCSVGFDLCSCVVDRRRVEAVIKTAAV